MPFLLIVGISISAFALFGLAQYGITSMVCDVGGANSLAGVLIHAVVGLMLGLPLAAAARLGGRPKRSAGSLVRPLVLMLVAMTAFAFAAGVVGFMMARSGNLGVPQQFQEQIPQAKWPAFQACALAQSASYYVAFVGDGMLVAWVWVSRKRFTPRR